MERDEFLRIWNDAMNSPESRARQKRIEQILQEGWTQRRGQDSAVPQATDILDMVLGVDGKYYVAGSFDTKKLENLETDDNG